LRREREREIEREREREPEQLPGPLRRETRGEPVSARTGRSRKSRRKLLDRTPTAKTYAGVDVSKDQLDVCVRYGEAGRNRSGATFAVPHDDAGIDALVSRLVEERPVLVIVEATGGFERAVVGASAAAGLAVAVVNPRQVREFARATGRLAKTDALDAEVLAHFAQAIQPAPRPLPDEEIRTLQGILARRRQLVGMLTAENNRLHSATKPVAKRIAANVRWLEKELSRTDGELDGAIKRRAPPCARTKRF
jgi:transposase